MIWMGALVFAMSFAFFADLAKMQEWAPVSYQKSILEHEFWRLWTGLFVHADLEHFISNFVMFVPLTFLLSGYFGAFLFPVLGILVGGLINLITIYTMNEQVGLLGMSGVIYWMGSVWITLFILIDKRITLRKRFAVGIFLTLMLFSAETYKPNVSYTSHFVGFVLGVACAFIYYHLNNKKFSEAEEFILILDEDDEISAPQDQQLPPMT